MAYGSSQARGRIGSTAASPHHSHSNARSESHPTPQLTATCCTARSLTHWARPGIEPVSTWVLVGFVTAEPQWGFLDFFFFFLGNVLVSYGCSKKWPQTWWLKTTHICNSLETRNPKKGLMRENQGVGKAGSLPEVLGWHPASRRCSHSLSGGPFLVFKVSSLASSSLTPSLWPLITSPLTPTFPSPCYRKALAMTPGRVDHPELPSQEP